METIEIILKVLEIAAVLIIGAGGSYYLIAKKKISAMRNLIIAIDDAVYDDKITEIEFRTIYESAKNLIGK